MKLNVEDISQYIVLLIFILVILKVLGPGISAYFVERFTGHKPSKDFELDELIKMKEGQFRRNEIFGAPKSQTTLNETNFLYAKNLLSSLQWGAPQEKYCPKTTKLIGEPIYNEGLIALTNSFLSKYNEEQLDEETFFEIFDKYVLWVNIFNTQKNNQALNSIDAIFSARALYSLMIREDINEAHSLGSEALQLDLDKIAQESFIEKLKINSLAIEEFFELWHKKSLLFKSLEPIVPLSKYKTSEWAKEVLKLEEGPNQDEIKARYKNIVSQAHPDKYSSLNLDDKLLEILNNNLSLINEAYKILTQSEE